MSAPAERTPETLAAFISAGRFILDPGPLTVELVETAKAAELDETAEVVELFICRLRTAVERAERALADGEV